MGEAAPDKTEQRSAERKRVLLTGKIVYGDYRFVVDCIIRDMSKTGVRVKSENPQDIPDEFYLFVKADAKLYPAHAIWKRGKEIGVEFVGEPINLVTTKDPRLNRFAYM